MASRDVLLKGGRKGASIVPGDAGASLLLERLTAQDKKTRMPKNREPLSAVEIEDVRKWIKAGAPWPDGIELVERKAAAFDWWSFKPLERPPVPRLEGAEAGWVRNPVDAFVLTRLLSKGLKPSAQADRLTLIRRLSYDLLGLPPTPAEVDRFLADKSPRAYEELVERLLASKHYGERWARRWLDVVKYADTCGYDKDKLRPNAWPYRDYVIRAFNNDKKYSRFVEEQLAGDVLFPGEPDGVLGLGFSENPRTCCISEDRLNIESLIDPVHQIWICIDDGNPMALGGESLGQMEAHHACADYDDAHKISRPLFLPIIGKSVLFPS